MSILSHSKKNGTYNEDSIYFSNFYHLFSKLVFTSNNGKTPKVITITSAVEGEGKTTIAHYLSFTAAVSLRGYYLLIDGDLRKPNLHKLLGVPREKGFSDILLNKGNTSEFIRRTRLSNLNLITAGKYINNPLILLNNPETKQFINKMTEHYKMIFIDSPPVIPVSDSLRLAQLADGVVLVVKAGKTPREVVKRAIQLLKDAQCNIIGIVLNDVGEVLPYYYQHKYYKYDYQPSYSSK